MVLDKAVFFAVVAVAVIHIVGVVRADEEGLDIVKKSSVDPVPISLLATDQSLSPQGGRVNHDKNNHRAPSDERELLGPGPRPRPEPRPRTEPRPGPEPRPRTEPRPGPVARPRTEPRPGPEPRPRTEPRPGPERISTGIAPRSGGRGSSLSGSELGGNRGRNGGSDTPRLIEGRPDLPPSGGPDDGQPLLDDDQSDLVADPNSPRQAIKPKLTSPNFRSESRSDQLSGRRQLKPASDNLSQGSRGDAPSGVRRPATDSGNNSEESSSGPRSGARRPEADSGNNLRGSSSGPRSGTGRTGPDSDINRPRPLGGRPRRSPRV